MTDHASSSSPPPRSPRRSPPASSPPSRSPRPTWPGSRPSTRRCTPSCTSTARARSPRPAPSTRSGRAGEKLGPLAGVPLALKDIFTTEGIPTTVGSKILEGWIPPYDATAHQAAARPPTSSSSARPTWTSSPWGPPPRTARTARPATRGTSPGSPAAPAAAPPPPSPRTRRRSPSAPTPAAPSASPPPSPAPSASSRPTAAVSRYGMVAFSSSLDQGGPCARTVLDAALLHEVIAGHDPLDSTSIDAPVPPVVEAARNGSVAGHARRRRQAVPRRGLPGRCRPALRRVRRAAARSWAPRSSSWTARPSTWRSPRTT